MKVTYEIIITTLLLQHMVCTCVNGKQTKIKNKLWPDLTDVLREAIDHFNVDSSEDCNSVNKTNVFLETNKVYDIKENMDGGGAVG
jgi:hypothetical protein